MKRNILILCSVMLIALLLVSCTKPIRNGYAGEYGGLVGGFVFVKLTLNADSTAEMAILGTVLSCVYEIEDTKLTLTMVHDWGYGFTITAEIDGNKIVFPIADKYIVTLEKGHTYDDFEEIFNNLRNKFDNFDDILNNIINDILNSIVDEENVVSTNDS